MCAFQLNNRQAKNKLKVDFDRVRVKYNWHPKYDYLGITLDRALTFNEHLSTLNNKIRFRIILVQMSAGTG